ncbi:hypothetical protein [Pseudomonas sp. KNUC1026]|uniref:hypothetical protein n=1 Tax=Pseudomonas sp. KNUC1026 TaxID=2893890 RepID=UPI001F3DC348|nr:hypothetical protein [Pseudomonas sp. KNUC1026]UFH50975.1 hypothetical protein LN139_07850 [Pseudomonas sp. KNUC1026]
MKEEIRAAAKKALKKGVLDDEIYNSDVIEAFVSPYEKSIECHVDIPIRKLIALRRREFYAPCATWREAALSLHCKGWDPFRADIVRYFTSDLMDKPFPAPGAEGELRIGFAGGAIYCKLGNHRAVAAKAWLAGNFGENEVFKKAKCFYRKIIPSLKDLMKRCLKEGSTLKYASVSTDHTYLRAHGICDLFMVKSKCSGFEIYELDNTLGTLTPIAPSENPIHRILRLDLRSKCARLKFEKIPVKLIETMLDDSAADELLVACRKASV